jgi:hypothetical protein
MPLHRKPNCAPFDGETAIRWQSSAVTWFDSLYVQAEFQDTDASTRYLHCGAQYSHGKTYRMSLGLKRPDVRPGHSSNSGFTIRSSRSLCVNANPVITRDDSLLDAVGSCLGGYRFMNVILLVLILLLLFGGGGGYYYGGPMVGGGIGGVLLIVLIVWLLMGRR